MSLIDGSNLLISLGQATGSSYDSEGNLIPEDDRTGIVTIQILNEDNNVLLAYSWIGTSGERQMPCEMPGCLKSLIIDGVLYIFYLNNTQDWRGNHKRSFLYSLSSKGDHNRICAAEGYYNSWQDYQEVSYEWSAQSFVITSKNDIVTAVGLRGKVDGNYQYPVVVMRSTDLGVSFEDAVYVDDCGHDVTRLVIDDNDIIYLVMNDVYEDVLPPFSLRKSIDSGRTWENVSTVPATPLVNPGYSILTVATAGSKLYVFYSNEQASDKSILYLTEDQGETWTTTEINTSPYSYFNYIALFAYEDVVCFVGRTENGSIYVHRSIDKGVSWTTIGTLKKSSYPYTTDWPNFVSNYSTYVTFSQDGPCFTYTSCGSYFKSTGALAFFTSMDAGLTWEVKQSGLPNDSGVPTITEKLE